MGRPPLKDRAARKAEIVAALRALEWQGGGTRRQIFEKIGLVSGPAWRDGGLLQR